MSDAPIHSSDVEPASWDIGELAATRRRLGAAMDAARIGVAVIEVPAGRRATPLHSHADEEEQFFVLEGTGLSVQMGSRGETSAHAIRQGDFLWHPAGGDAHTLVAGDGGLKVLVVAEGSRTGITYLPRAQQFWLGPRWSPADMPHPFVADTKLGPLEVPAPTDRPPTIRNLDELEVDEGRDGRAAWASRFLTTREQARLVLAHDTMPPDTHTTRLHFHTTREEAWYVLSGSGHARLGDETYELRAGSFWLRRPDRGIGHRIEVGPEGMELLTMGDLLAGDCAVYPEEREVRLAAGVVIGYEPR